MSPRRSARLDAVLTAALVFGMGVAVCVLTYDVADPPNRRVFPPHAQPGNALGYPGAVVAACLWDAFGIAVYPLLAGWFALLLALLLRHDLRHWPVRLAGWTLLVPGIAVIADQLPFLTRGGPIYGGGGSLGAWSFIWLSERLPPGAFPACVCAALVCGIAAATGIAPGRILQRLVRSIAEAVHRARLVRAGKPIMKRHSMAIQPKPTLTVAPSAEPGHIPIHYPIAATAPNAERPRVAIATDTGAPGEERFRDYEAPPLSLLDEPQPFPYEAHDQRLRERAAVLEKTFTDFNLNVRVVGINTGPVITQYEIALETGLRVHKVTRLADDLAINLKVPSVRVVAPIPGKNTVGVEIPNDHRAVVRLKEVIALAGARAAKSKIPLFLGKDTEGQPLIYDLAEMPHLLIAGRTGTGKSVCMNAIILSMLMTRRPDEIKMVMIDPKMLELSEYGRIPHLMHPVVKDMKKAEAILAWAVDKMEERYDLLSRARVRGIAGYNELTLEEIHRRVQPADDEERRRIPAHMPYIVIFVDEMNDLMMTMKKEVEGHIIRLAQKSRAAGIHLVVATQKPTVDVITGLIKSNLPARICFQVSSRSDSRVVLDEMGADKLLGKGDMLFLQPGTSTLLRAQGTYAGDEEITRVVGHLECDPCFATELVQLGASAREEGGSFIESLRARDEVYEQAIEVVVREGRGSVSLLQRTLGIGYGRAARLIDFMAEDGIVGNYNGSQARDVLYTPEKWQEVKQAG